MRINTNALAMNASRNVSNNNTAIQGNIEKLSSGLRINRAADDAAGLVISEGMRAQIAGLDQAIRNSNDGINMIKTSEGALNEVHSLLRSMRTLAVHAANSGVNSAAAVAADQAQLDSAATSISRIGSNTQFNGKKLFTGNLGVTGVNESPTYASFKTGTGNVAGGSYTVDITTAATQSTTTTTGLASVSADTVFTVNGVEIKNGGSNAASMVSAINAKTAQTGVSAAFNTASGLTDQIVFTNSEYGSLDAPSIGVSGGTTTLTTLTTAAGDDVAATVSGPNGAVATKSSSGRTLVLDNGLTLTASGTASATSRSVTVTNNSAQFQIGANAGETANVSIDAMNANVLDVHNLNLGTSSGANAALAKIDAAIETISTRRAELGSFQKNVLESNVTSLGVAKENLSASESTIRDTDMAAEMVSFTKNQILVQASQAMLAQANQSSQGVLSLLRG